MRAGLLVGLCVAAAAACQSYNMERVEEQVVIAVETAGTFVSSKAPVLLIVQDRSGSMKTCFGAKVNETNQCDRDGNNTLDVDGRLTRMQAASEVLSTVVEANGSGVFFGLSIYGVPEGGQGCGPPELLVPPGADTAASVVSAYESDPDLLAPNGGTPTTLALEQAYDTLVDNSGNLREPDRKNFVLLVTDGLMNCNQAFSDDVPCVCPNEGGCPGRIDYGAVIPAPLRPDQRGLCLDDAASRAAVERLRLAGVNTFVIGLGEAFAGGEADLAVRTLNDLAVAGGVPRQGEVKFYPAGDPAALEASLSAIVRSITAPCAYELDGEICDGRLVSIALTVTDSEGATPRTIETRCDAAAGPNTWFFDAGDPRRLSFDDALCRELEDAVEVKITIRGVENACPEGVTPACAQP